jgi:hypothetical protein
MIGQTAGRVNMKFCYLYMVLPELAGIHGICEAGSRIKYAKVRISADFIVLLCFLKGYMEESMGRISIAAPAY